MSTLFKRELTLRSTDGRTSRTVTVSFGPMSTDKNGNRSLRVTIDGLFDAPWSLDVGGADDVQAVQLAMKIAAARLESSREYEEGRLYWLDPTAGHGLASSLERIE